MNIKIPSIVFNLILFLLGIVSGFAQHDTSHQLPVFTINENRISRFSCGLHVEKLDSLQLRSAGCSSIGDVLANTTSSYVKSMGPGSLSAFSMRGCSVYQTAIVWNGIDIRAPGAGMIDITLIPASFFETVEILHGGASSLSGSGVIGGSLILENHPEFKPDKVVVAGITFANFGGNNQQLSVKWSGEKYYTSTTAFRQFSLNNFQYNYANETRKNLHGMQEQKGIMQNVQIKNGNSQSYGYSLWLQESDREIAPSMTSSDNNASRNDASFRFLPSFRFLKGKNSFQLKGSFLYDFLRYREIPGDSIVLINSVITNNSLSAEAEYNHVFVNGIHIGSGINAQLISVDVNSNGGLNKQLQSAGFIDARKEWKSKWIVSLSVRHQIVEGYHSFVSPSVGVEGNVLKKLRFRSNFSRNYRIPSLNDRFWQPGGNQDLLPEISINAESGLDYLFDLSELARLGIHSTVFISDISNWISWMPGTNFWSVQNIQHVINRGVESSLELNSRIQNIRYRIKGNYTFVRSTYQNEILKNDLNSGKQLIYVPTHRFSGQLSLTYKLYSLIYQHGYTGRTYVTSDNVEFLPVYDLANVSFSSDLPQYKRISINIHIEIMNIWNKEYQVVQYYPMPGRWMKGGLVIKWLKPARNAAFAGSYL